MTVEVQPDPVGQPRQVDDAVAGGAGVFGDLGEENTGDQQPEEEGGGGDDESEDDWGARETAEIPGFVDERDRGE